MADLNALRLIVLGILCCSVYSFSTGHRFSITLAPSPVKLQASCPDEFSRRQALSIGLATTGATFLPSIAGAKSDEYTPAKRPFAYRVDSSIPPTLLPLNAQQEQAILRGLGKGSGTGKAGVVADRITFNNMMNKGVFGTISALQSATGTNENEVKKSGTGYATFIALGVPKNTTDEDVGLATGLMAFIMQGRKSQKGAAALGLPFAPLSTQPALDSFQTTGDVNQISDALMKAGVSEATVDLYKPLLALAKSSSLDLIAMSPEIEDIKVVRSQGLQNIDPDRRAQYVVDSEGFIALTQDPRFRLYTDRSLLKDFEPQGKSDQTGNFFAERILVHETGATALAKYTSTRPESLVVFVAPIADVRFLGGYNGRLARISGFLNKEDNKVTDDCITTILLNPTARETLSLSRYLRLEIGTAPTNIDYQTKVADYLWFSKMPKVNMIPRLMNA
jgi:hypothetical protein